MIFIVTAQLDAIYIAVPGKRMDLLESRTRSDCPDGRRIIAPEINIPVQVDRRMASISFPIEIVILASVDPEKMDAYISMLILNG